MPHAFTTILLGDHVADVLELEGEEVRPNHRSVPIRFADFGAAARLQALVAAQAGEDLVTAVRLASFGVKDFALSKRAGDFRAALAGLKRQEGYGKAYRSLAKERAYRRLVKQAVLSEVEGNESRAVTAGRYRAALPAAPEPTREEVRQHAQAISAASSR